MLVGFMDALPWDEDMEFMCGERWVADEGREVKWCGLVGFASGDFVRVQCVLLLADEVWLGFESLTYVKVLRP